MTEVGFEPTPPKRLVPKTSALDHSATLPLIVFHGNIFHIVPLEITVSVAQSVSAFGC